MKRDRKPCAAGRKHHSRDRVTVYHGTQTPLVLCGYHATRLDQLFTLNSKDA